MYSFSHAWITSHSPALLSLQRTGSKETISASTAKSFWPRRRRKSPFMPQFLLYEFLTIQYLVCVLSSKPHPTSMTEWFWFCQEKPRDSMVFLLGSFSDLSFYWLMLPLPSSGFAPPSCSRDAGSSLMFESVWTKTPLMRALNAEMLWSSSRPRAWRSRVCFVMPYSDRIPLW